jgi:DNA-binding NarL/FixJ family response regulator
VTAKTQTTAVLFDRSQLWLKSLARALPALGVEVRGQTTSAERAIVLVMNHTPQLLVAGIGVGGNAAGDLSCIRRARELVVALQVVVWSSVDESRAVKAAFEAGAAAYVLKTARPEDISVAIRQIFERSVYLAKEWPFADVTAQAQTDASAILTRRELEILRLVADGHSNAHIAGMLWVTDDTVKFHLKNIYQKLGVTNRTEASRWAHLHGVVFSEPREPPASDPRRYETPGP